MRTIAYMFVFLAAAAPAVAQGTVQPRFDLNFSIGAMAAEVEPARDRYGDEWYSEGRYAVGLGYAWTRQLKTEVEYAYTGEGSVYTEQLFRVPGTSVTQSLSVESFHRIQHVAVRGVWEFLPNTWIQPYVNAGGVVEIDRMRQYGPPQFYYPPPPDPRTPTIPVPIRPEVNAGPSTEYRGGFTVGGGSKFFVSPNSYINGGMQISYAKPATSIAFLAGFGVTF